MGNVVMMTGTENIEQRRVIADMEPGETGYTVPWAFDQKTENLDTKFCLADKGGTASLFVWCIAPGQYALKFEKPKYKNLVLGEL